ncbi:hypothetical protein AVEN_52130-1 [Araneus ventricosus]|uniref:Uncharacterized protein n=1 Tax=Araneus ventricosus TaxID=182803 RepID=A0A4Y2E6L0_ARAVE|nr:hypothetical protein AVEN_52130-1 [Araneus ventricosus]
MNSKRYDFSIVTLNNSYKNHPGLAQNRPVYLSDDRCNSSSDEVGVLIAITGCGLTPNLGGKHYHRQKASLNHYCTHQGSENTLTYPAASHLRTRGTTPLGHDFE